MRRIAIAVALVLGAGCGGAENDVPPCTPPADEWVTAMDPCHGAGDYCQNVVTVDGVPSCVCDAICAALP